MRRFPGSKPTLFVFLAGLAVPVCAAVSPNSKLLALVPPNAQVVAGLDAPPLKDQVGSLILTTRNNNADLRDFLALTGVDSSRWVDHVILVAADNAKYPLAEHSLMASGHFDQARIYKSAEEGGAEVAHYHGITVLAIQPFARERGEFNDVRWLAIPDPDILLFGTIANVNQELDRYFTRSKVDPLLAGKLAHLRRDDQSWCVFSEPGWNTRISNWFVALDPRLADLIQNAGNLMFGVHFGKQVEFEYEVGPASTTAAHSISDALLPVSGSAKESSLLPIPGMTMNDNTVHGVIKFSMPRYNAWMNGITVQINNSGAASH